MSDKNNSVNGEQTTTAETEKKKRSPGKKSSAAVNGLVARFAACGRCSFFLAGYRAMVGEDGMEAAAASEEQETLTLTWQYAMRELVSKSYGVQLDLDFFHYNGCCPECGRAFMFRAEPAVAAEDEPDTAPVFTIDY